MKLRCPHCTVVLGMKEEQPPGAVVTCAKCGARIGVPAGDDDVLDGIVIPGHGPRPEVKLPPNSPAARAARSKQAPPPSDPVLPLAPEPAAPESDGEDEKEEDLPMLPLAEETRRPTSQRSTVRAPYNRDSSRLSPRAASRQRTSSRSTGRAGSRSSRSRSRDDDGGVCQACRRADGFPVKIGHCWSVVVMTSYSESQYLLCESCTKEKARGANIASMIFGWWGIPWGPIRTIQALSVNKKAKNEVARLAARARRRNRS